MKRRPRWMESVLRTANAPLPAMPFVRVAQPQAA